MCELEKEISEVCSVHISQIKEDFFDLQDEIIATIKKLEERNKKTYQEALKFFGPESQIKKMLEEMAELQDAILKEGQARKSVYDIAEEIADVDIMLRQMALHYNIEHTVNKIKQDKLERLRKRIRDKKKDREIEAETIKQFGGMLLNPLLGLGEDKMPVVQEHDKIYIKNKGMTR